MNIIKATPYAPEYNYLIELPTMKEMFFIASV